MIGVRLTIIISLTYHCTSWRCWDNQWTYCNNFLLNLS